MAELKVFHDSIVPIPVESGLTANGLMVQPAASEHMQDTMTLHFSLALPPDMERDLEAKVARGETVPLDALHRDYAAAVSDMQSLVDWLKSEGFEITSVSPDNTSVFASAPVSQIEKSLGVTMVRVTHSGITYTAARNAPSLPASVGRAVQAIGGLQPFHRAHKHGKCLPPHKGNRAGLGLPADALPEPAPNIANAPPYVVSEILKAYDANGLNVNGSGQTIAILIDTVPSDADLQAFWQRNNLPVTIAQIEKINVAGTPLGAPEGEETLDVEWSSGIAPGAKIRIYATGSLSFSDLDRGLDRILADLPEHPEIRQLSISLGLGETYFNGPGGEVSIEHQKFLKLAAGGVNVFVSTGDAGSNPDQTGHSASGPLQVEYESSDPCVVAVGGTSLKLANDGTVASEVAWASGGGGNSMYFPRPTWQTTPTTTGNRRLVPDVSLTADPNEGAFVVLNGHIQQYGGTSWSAPVWAGFCALINAARAEAGKKPLSFLNPSMYSQGSKCFRDITGGSNGSYHATNGFDLTTGLGVPNVKALIANLP